MINSRDMSFWATDKFYRDIPYHSWGNVVETPKEFSRNDGRNAAQIRVPPTALIQGLPDGLRQRVRRAGVLLALCTT